LPPGDYLGDFEFQEPHRRGEILVAAVLTSFLGIWLDRLRPLKHDGFVDLERAVEEGATAADHLLTMAIRAIDFMPPIDVLLGDYLRALLTADVESCPDDSRYHYRDSLTEAFRKYGMARTEPSQLVWERPHRVMSYDRLHFESLKTDPVEVFHFLWENRRALRLSEQYYTEVLSVRPVMRVGNDGFVVRETVAEYVQVADLRADELKAMGVRRPDGMPDWQRVLLYGGGALIFDEFSGLKYHVQNRLESAHRQTDRLEYLWNTGFFERLRARSQPVERPHAAMHLRRALDIQTDKLQRWR
jgi:hypothetical protein